MGGAARCCLSNVSFEIPRSILISSASRGVAEGRELKNSRKPVREKTGRTKVPFDNFDPENYFGDAGVRNPATRCASPVTIVQGVENALRGDFDLRLKRRHSTQARVFSEPACILNPR